ncbi:MAG: peptidoglycan-binding protein [Solirubrobacteraceae bacterium MAG38_C4-C5]|nr:peptidoglycan-binding protein [Candidatus Siliceabacter maunaloa]
MPRPSAALRALLITALLVLAALPATTFAAPNGRLPAAQLAAVWHPDRDDHTLAQESAAAWNTLRLCADADGLPLHGVDKPGSAYRDLDRQRRLFELFREGRGNPAATPGRSNHGAGVAIDLDTRRMRAWLDDNGRPLGWAKAWSDAPGEWWHIRYRAGIWDRRPDPGARRGAPRLAEGSGGPCQAPWVARLQERLLAHGATGVGAQGRFGPATERSLRAFQRSLGLPGTGETDGATWSALTAAAPAGGGIASADAGVAHAEAGAGGLDRGTTACAPPSPDAL